MGWNGKASVTPPTIPRQGRITFYVYQHTSALPQQFWPKFADKDSSMTDKPGQERKRKASTALRTLANELQVGGRGRNSDLTKPQFASLLEAVEGHCSTPDQRRRAEEAKALYYAGARLPPIPLSPTLAASLPVTSSLPTSSALAQVLRVRHLDCRVVVVAVYGERTKTKQDILFIIS